MQPCKYLFTPPVKISHYLLVFELFTDIKNLLSIMPFLSNNYSLVKAICSSCETQVILTEMMEINKTQTPNT